MKLRSETNCLPCQPEGIRSTSGMIPQRLTQPTPPPTDFLPLIPSNPPSK